MNPVDVDIFVNNSLHELLGSGQGHVERHVAGTDYEIAWYRNEGDPEQVKLDLCLAVVRPGKSQETPTDTSFALVGEDAEQEKALASYLKDKLAELFGQLVG